MFARVYKRITFPLLAVFMILSINSCKKHGDNKSKVLKNDLIKAVKGDIKITPVNHGTFVIETGSASIYVDPVGSKDAYASFKKPDIILLTDIHGDHLSVKTVAEIKGENTLIVGPKAVADKLKGTSILKNGQVKVISGISIKAIPMYNLTRERLKFHTKGRGNGYLITLNAKRIYISGDTEDIPEMRSLKNIDIAFVCMNLPYTMTVEQAASAVLDFKPGIVYPFHYRGKKDGKAVFSDINKFRKLVSKNSKIDVRFLKWY